jgi:cobalt-zinc-cadmium efflux system membrane fusion protein
MRIFNIFIIKNFTFYFILCCVLLLSGIYSTPIFAHGDGIKVGGDGPKGPVQLTPAQQEAIGLKTVSAAPHPLSVLLPLNGVVQLLPNKQADVTTRISGQVTEIYVNLNDPVIVGQRLVKVQSRLVGDPPPSVVINAPMSGIIDMRNVNVGQAIEPNTILFHISDRATMLVLANVYEEDIGKIKVGQAANIHLLSYPDKAFEGQVTLIEPNLDPISRTTKVWVVVDNSQKLLKPDMFARINVILEKKESTLSVPNVAIIEANGEKFVFVRDGKKYQRVEVTTGASDDNDTEIVDGLVPGDEVVTQGNRQLYTMWLIGGQTKAGD